MDSKVIWEIIGYLGSALVLVSLLMSSVIKLRIINLIGSLVFAIYAFQIQSIPTAFMNLALVGIDLYFLLKYLRKDRARTFTVLSVKADDSAVQAILSKYQSDMELYFGRIELSEANLLLAVYEGDTLAGLSAVCTEGNDAELILDYATPSYRDCSVGAFVLETLSKDYDRVLFRKPKEKHIPYLLRMGYVQNGDVYTRKL